MEVDNNGRKWKRRGRGRRETEGESNAMLKITQTLQPWHVFPLFPYSTMMSKSLGLK